MVRESALYTSLRRWGKTAQRRLGWAGITGTALLIAAVTLAAVAPALEQAAQDTRAALERKRLELSQAPLPAPQPPTQQELTQRFVEDFPSFDQNASDMQRLFASADHAIVHLLKGDYALKSETGSPFITYTVTLPMHESYEALKAFSANVLRDMPHAALDELRMTRTESTAADLNATVRFTFAYRRP
ncbi:MAG: hypothetical protein WA210_13585 [Burkholderiaceae bacterium]